MASKQDGTSPCQPASQPNNSQQQSVTPPDAAAAHRSDQAPKLGTGVFMPMVGATRSYNSARSKPQRHRNASTSCLDARTTNGARGMPRRQHSSSAGLGLVQQHSGVCPTPGTSPAGEPFLGPAPAQRPVLTSTGGGLRASASTVMLMEAGQPSSHAFAADQQQLQYQQQIVSPFSMMASCSSSSGIAAVPGSECAAPLQAARLVSLGSAGMASAASSHLSTLQHSGGFLHATGTGAFHSQPPVLQLPTGAQQPSALLGPLGRVAAAPVHTTLSMPGIEAVGHASGALTADSSPALLSGPLLGSEPSVLGSDVMAQWTALGLSEQDLLTALLAEGQGCDLALQQDEITRTIQQLRLMKQLLRLKQQHKAQQRMLQAQQQQQQQQLQQQLLHNEASGRGHCNEPQQLQQELLQLLHRRGGQAPPLGVPVTTAAPASMLQACPIALSEGGVGDAVSTSPNSISGGLQQLLGQGALQTADALVLGSLLQERVSLQQQVVVQTAPANLFVQQPHSSSVQHDITHGAPSGLVLQGWQL